MGMRVAAWGFAFWMMFGGSSVLAQSKLVAPNDAMDAYRTVDRWVRDWQVPGTADETTEHGPYRVVAVTIRIDGRVVGRSSLGSMTPDPQLLWRATRQAMHRAGTHLPTDRQAGWEADRASMIASMTLTVELASVLIPIAESELALEGFGLTPGSVGVAVRLGETVEPMTVDAILMQGVDSTDAVRSLAVEILDDGALALESIDELIARGLVLYRFEQVALAQSRAGLGAEFLDRGSRVIHGSEINTASLRGFAQGLSEHLRAQRWAGIERYGMKGTLNPVTGKHEPMVASAFEQGIAALALLRYGSLGETPSHQFARKGGRDVLRDLSVVEPGELAVDEDFVGAAACLVALGEIDSEVIDMTPELAALREQVVVALGRAFTQAGGFDASVPESARGLVAWAMVRGAAMDSRISHADAAAAVRAVFRSVPASRLVGQMPFLGWAELEAAGDGAIPAGVVLDDMRQMVWDHMLRPTDLDRVDRDLAGGIVFTASGAPLPSWHSLRPLAFIATMLGDDRLTPGTLVSGRVPREIGELVQSIRFVRQLAATGPEMRMYRRAEASRWGIRVSLWDQRMPIESSAMALLMVSETLASLDEVSSRPMPKSDRVFE